MSGRQLLWNVRQLDQDLECSCHQVSMQVFTILMTKRGHDRNNALQPPLSFHPVDRHASSLHNTGPPPHGRR